MASLILLNDSSSFWNHRPWHQHERKMNVPIENNLHTHDFLIRHPLVVNKFRYGGPFIADDLGICRQLRAYSRDIEYSKFHKLKFTLKITEQNSLLARFESSSVLDKSSKSSKNPSLDVSTCRLRIESCSWMDTVVALRAQAVRIISLALSTLLWQARVALHPMLCCSKTLLITPTTAKVGNIPFTGGIRITSSFC